MTHDFSTVFVDGLLAYPIPREAQARRVALRNGGQWCHLFSHDVEALHRMARRIGMRREWFQNHPRFPHYDLTPGRRQVALQAGAVERPLSDWIREHRFMGAVHTVPAEFFGGYSR